MPCTRADCTKHRQLTKSDKVSVITMPSSSSWRKWGARCYTAVQCAYTCRIVVFSGQLDKPRMPCMGANCTKHRQLTKSDKVSVITMPSSSSWRKWGARCYTAVQCAYTCRIVVFSGQLDKPRMPCMGADCTKHRQLWSLVVSWISQGLLNLSTKVSLIHHLHHGGHVVR